MVSTIRKTTTLKTHFRNLFEGLLKGVDTGTGTFQTHAVEGSHCHPRHACPFLVLLLVHLCPECLESISDILSMLVWWSCLHLTSDESVGKCHYSCLASVTQTFNFIAIYILCAGWLKTLYMWVLSTVHQKLWNSAYLK